jgi:hypothetical protein
MTRCTPRRQTPLTGHGYTNGGARSRPRQGCGTGVQASRLSHALDEVELGVRLERAWYLLQAGRGPVHHVSFVAGRGNRLACALCPRGYCETEMVFPPVREVGERERSSDASSAPPLWDDT